MKITMYELLGMVKEGKAPKKIKYHNEILYFDDKTKNYYDDEDRNPLFNKINYILDNEVEILEEKKIPEKLEMYNITDETINGLRESMNVLNEDMVSKINEIIDYLDYLKSKGE